MKDVIDLTVSKHPIKVHDLEDIDKLSERVEEVTLQIEHPEKVRDAMDQDENWKTMSAEFAYRLESITRSFFANNNPSDPNIQMKFATAWGQFNEVLRLTEAQLGVKKELEQFKNERVSVLDRIESVWKRVTKQTR